MYVDFKTVYKRLYPIKTESVQAIELACKFIDKHYRTNSRLIHWTVKIHKIDSIMVFPDFFQTHISLEIFHKYLMIVYEKLWEVII